jgi:AbrB family looped-hinge helix DNA binding protein
MHKVTAKRQVTLPQAVCNAISLQSGDYVEVFARDGDAHIVKMTSESLAGKFSYLLKNQAYPTAEDIKTALKQRAVDKFVADDRY